MHTVGSNELLMIVWMQKISRERYLNDLYFMRFYEHVVVSSGSIYLVLEQSLNEILMNFNTSCWHD
jgi:hypothetical protein